MTIADVKERVCLLEGIDPSLQRILVRGKQLQDHETLGDYSVKADEVLLMILRGPFGGMFHQTSGRKDFDEQGGRVLRVLLPNGECCNMLVRLSVLVLWDVHACCMLLAWLQSLGTCKQLLWTLHCDNTCLAPTDDVSLACVFPPYALVMVQRPNMAKSSAHHFHFEA